MLTISLLGPPAIERDGRPVPPPRGRKAWALLCYLLLAERPPSRRHLAELLFGEADDPLAALRWTLAEIRRALGRPEVLRGDPVTTVLGEDVAVDIRAVWSEPVDPAALLEAGGRLLEGVELAGNLEFELWLLVARHRVAATVEAGLREAAVRLLAAGQRRCDPVRVPRGGAEPARGGQPWPAGSRPGHGGRPVRSAAAGRRV